MPTVNSMDLPQTARVLPTITIYGPRDCPNFDKAIQLFERKGIAYTKIDLSRATRTTATSLRSSAASRPR